MIECIRFKSHEKGFVQGFADLYIEKWGIEVHGFTLMMKDGKRWLNSPGKEYTTKEGVKKFKSFIYFKDRDRWELFTTESKKAIDKWCEENPPYQNENNNNSRNTEHNNVPF